jgi:N-acetylglucosamine-6-sulfatase
MTHLSGRNPALALGLWIALVAVAMGPFVPIRPKLERVEAASGVSSALDQAPHNSDPTSRPNIVVVMFDDLDVASLQRMLAMPSDLPGQDVMLYHLKKHIVQQGITFTESFVTNALCCPSRATFLTGKYAHNHGARTNLPPIGGITALDDTSTVATWLQSGGYRTGYIGKYLNGYGSWNETHRAYVPGSSAPDRRLAPTYQPPGWDSWVPLIDPYSYNMYDYQLNDNGVVRTYGAAPADYQTDVLREYARVFIADALTNHAKQPFFLTVMPLAPHIELSTVDRWDSFKDPWRWYVRPAPRHQDTVKLPLIPDYARHPAFDEADITDKPFWRPRLNLEDRAALRNKYKLRLESLRAVDDLLGEMVTALGPAIENTIIIVTSDNGYLLGEHRLVEKLAPYEASIRVPLFIRLPLSYLHTLGASGYKPWVSKDLVVNTDLAPTIAALAGVAAPDVDGRSLLPALRAAIGNTMAPSWRKQFLVEHWWMLSIHELPTYAGVRSGSQASIPNALYVEYYAQKGMEQILWDQPTFREFYPLDKDPAQLASLPDHPSVPNMSRLLKDLRTCGNSTGQLRCPDAENSS